MTHKCTELDDIVHVQINPLLLYKVDGLDIKGDRQFNALKISNIDIL